MASIAKTHQKHLRYLANRPPKGSVFGAENPGKER